MGRIVIYLTFLMLLIASCKSKYQKLLTGTDYYKKYEEAIRYYEKEDYYRSQQLLESIITVYRGTEKAETINYYLANCYMKQSDYLYAGYYFNNFTTTFPTSEKLEECMFLSGYCYYKESAKYSLDQEYTYKSLDEFELFNSKFPESDSAASAKKYVSLLMKKLHKKAYENAKLYEKVGSYKAAVIALRNCIYDYPDIEYRESIMFLIVKASYKLAQNSVDSKKYERYEYVIDEYFNYVDEYPSGEYLKQAEHMFAESKKYIDKF